jgi:hypothetical protein
MIPREIFTMLIPTGFLWGRGTDAVDIAGGIYWAFSSVPSGYPRAYQSLNVKLDRGFVDLSYIKSTNEIKLKILQLQGNLYPLWRRQ